MAIRLLRVVAAWLVLTFVAPPRTAAASGDLPPLNFVFFLVDDLGWRDLGCYGSTFYETPAIDALADRGMRFTAAYAACPVCSPTRASIQSGKYPARLATTDWFGAVQPEEALHHQRFGKLPLLPAPYLEHLPLEEFTLAEALADAGYATFFAGKWHLGDTAEFWPEAQGYRTNMGGFSAGHPRGNGYFSPYKNPRLSDGPAGEHLTERLAAETAEFIRSNPDQPFFAMLSFYAVHTPLDTHPQLKAKYAAKATQVAHDGPRFVPEGQRKSRQVQDHPVYAGMVESMDAAVGMVLAAVEEAGVADRTAVIFTSDNGGLSTSEGSPTSNVPLRAGKGWLYEGGIREPMIVHWPGVTPGGAVCDQPVTSTDFYPTMLDMAGLPLRPAQHVDGVSFAPLLRPGPADAKFERGPLFWHYPHYGNQGGSPGAAIRSGDWKLIEFFAEDRVELYNLVADIGEQHDVAAEQPQRVAELRDALHQWQAEVNARLPTANPRYAEQQ
ncbi:MAG: sulfatase [Planctomycetaceae bacterium]|nr:sulfatase [Planctomycetaceae bacterium]